MFKILTIVVILVFSKSESKRILAVFSTPSISHQIVFRPLMQELAKRGHEVTVITTDPAFPKGQNPQNLTEIDVHDISYDIWNKYILFEKGKAVDQIEQVKLAFELLGAVFEEQVKSIEVQKLIQDKERKFDLLFIESCVRPSLSFSYLYKVPVIEFSSLGGLIGTFEAVGAAAQPLIYPIPIQRRLYNLTLWEKLSELYLHFSFKRMYYNLEISENEMLKKVFSPNIPDLSELRKNVQLIFLNVHPIWDFNRPVPPNVIYLGGLHQKQAKQLPKDLKSYLDASRNGVIYISFGTNMKPSLLPLEKLQIFTKTFSQLPYDVLWKWDKEEFPECPKNIKIGKWFPQSDLLKHPNIKVFITQGGLQSTDEALTAGVPLIGIPMHGDQWFNTEQYVIHNIGTKLSLETLTVDELIKAINNIISDPSYRENVLNLRTVMNDKPLLPLERAVWWTEYVLRHGGAARLKTRAAHMHWIEYYEIEIILLLAITGISLIIATMISVYLFRKLKFFGIKVKVN